MNHRTGAKPSLELLHQIPGHQQSLATSKPRQFCKPVVWSQPTPSRFFLSRTLTRSGAAARRQLSGLPRARPLGARGSFPLSLRHRDPTDRSLRISRQDLGNEPARGLRAGKQKRRRNPMPHLCAPAAGKSGARMQATPLVAGLENPMPAFGPGRKE